MPRAVRLHTAPSDPRLQARRRAVAGPGAAADPGLRADLVRAARPLSRPARLRRTGPAAAAAAAAIALGVAPLIAILPEPGAAGPAFAASPEQQVALQIRAQGRLQGMRPSR
ncbi:hypothetical protein ACQ5SO_16505 [Rhodovulum sp. DZ06]|uniref:hypothetical protein n=1 Tax=Rhodovulum sp. DZ06 TaxID=3425126 RepID=UPI003D342A6A